MNMNSSKSTPLLGNDLYSGREKTGDVTFIVDSERIRAHRCVLAALSPKYEAQFFNQPDEGDVHVMDVSAAAFKEFIKLFYLGEADFTLENIEDILNLSKQCLVDNFIDKCQSFLRSIIITANNVCWMYHLAILYDLKSVRDFSENFIGTNTKEVLSGNDFLECGYDTLLYILDIEPLACKEIFVLERCIKWAVSSRHRKNLDSMEIGNLRAELGDVVTKIRLKSISLNEFVNFNETYKGFFSAEEFIEVINILGELEYFTPQKFNNSLRKSPKTIFVEPQWFLP